MKRALDLFAGAGGVSVGLARAGFELTAVDSNPKVEKYWRLGMERHAPDAIGGFIVADALEVLAEIDWLLQFDFIWASPPCQHYSVATRITGNQSDHPDLVAPVRDALVASGRPYAIENVPGSPLGGAHPLVVLCGTMFGLETPDGRAEIRRHRWFELSFPVLFRPQCQHGGPAVSVTGHAAEISPRGWGRRESLSVTGTGLDSNRERWAYRRALKVAANTPRSDNLAKRVLCVAGGKAMSGGMAEPQGSRKRRVMKVAGSTPQRKESSDYGRNIARETFSIEKAQAAMGIDWMPMRYLSQAIPPAYAQWIGERAIEAKCLRSE